MTTCRIAITFFISYWKTPTIAEKNAVKPPKKQLKINIR